MESLNCSNHSIQICIKQPSWNSSSNCFLKTICPLEQKPGNHGGSDLIRYQDGQELNSNLYICQTTSSSKPYVLMSRNLIGWFRPKRYSYMLLSFHLDAEDDHALNSLLGIFQTTSSNPYILLSRNLLGCIMQHGDSE